MIPNNQLHHGPNLHTRPPHCTYPCRRRANPGREACWWIATAYVAKKQHSRRWSVTAHGDRKALRMAIAQRQEWEELQKDMN